MRIGRIFYFDAAHFLPKHEGKCQRLHGHTYKLEVVIESDVNPITGMVLDFKIIKEIVNANILALVDHSDLSRFLFLENPTAENICQWIYNELNSAFKKFGVALHSVRLWEGRGKWVELVKS